MQPRYHHQTTGVTGAAHTLLLTLNVKPLGETPPLGGSCPRNDMGDRVALLLLAVAASALAAEVRKICFCEVFPPYCCCIKLAGVGFNSTGS